MVCIESLWCNSIRMSEWLVFNGKEVMYCYILARTSYIRRDDNDICFELDQYFSWT